MCSIMHGCRVGVEYKSVSEMQRELFTSGEGHVFWDNTSILWLQPGKIKSVCKCTLYSIGMNKAGGARNLHVSLRIYLWI